MEAPSHYYTASSACTSESRRSTRSPCRRSVTHTQTHTHTHTHTHTYRYGLVGHVQAHQVRVNVDYHRTLKWTKVTQLCASALRRSWRWLSLPVSLLR